MVGLGQKVVTLAPTIDTKGDAANPNSKKPGDFLFGEENLIYIDADTEGKLKYVKVTYEYEDEYGVTQRKEVFAKEDENKNWVANIDTTGIPDQKITARIEASDTADRVTTSTEIVYTVKNNPPFVNMLIPNAVANYDKVTQYNTKKFDNSNPTLQSVVMDSYISGVFDDLAGIAPGYPMIKIWKEGEEEPGTHGTTDKNNSGYLNVTALNNNPGDGWINVDDGIVKSEKGSQAGSFKYFLREHKANGSWYEQGDGKALGVGEYRLKILAKDMTGKVLEWPKDAYIWSEDTPDSARCMKIKIIDQDLPPQITITDPVAMYLRDDFKIKAEAKSGGERFLAEMYVKAEGKKQNSEGKVLYVTLSKNTIPPSAKAFKGEIETAKINIGKTYYSMGENELAIAVDSEDKVPIDAYSFVTFVDGTYNFIASALSETGSEGKDLKTIYIDQTPPKAEITRVSRKILDYRPDTVTPSLIAEDKPFGFTAEKAKISEYRRWTVNSTVAIDVSTTDNRGNAIDKDNYIKFKYILLKDNDIGISALENIIEGDKLKEQEFSEYLYDRDDAEFFEKTVKSSIPSSNGNPLVKVTGKDGAYTLTLQTRQYDERKKYKLWLYVVALDNAGNANFQKILLNVDQDTDKPNITFGNINAEGSSNGMTFMDGKYGIRFDVNDDNGLEGGTSVEARFAKNIGNRDSLISSNSGWFKLPGTITEDKLSIYIDNLRLIEIALRMNGNNYSGNEDLEEHKTLLGNENDTKYIQIRATDSTYGKIYETDGTYTETTEWRPFRIDLTIPEIKISVKDIKGNDITRDEQSPFIAPVKEGSYTKTTDFTAYGDIVEQNISKIEVKIDGKTARNETVSDPVYSASALAPVGKDIAVWKTVNSGWDGELRFCIPFSSDEFFKAGSSLYLQDGSHTFEINFYDKAGQYATQTITFYIDTRGPDIDVIIPSGNIYLNDIKNITQAEWDKLLANSIKDANAKLIGSFKDSYSPVFSSSNNQYWYAINSSGWLSAGILPENISDSKSVTWQIPISDKDIDGVYTLSMRVKDSLGNGYDSSKPVTSDDTGGYLNNIAYMLDRNIPQLKDIEIYSETKSQGAGFTVKGTVYDTYSISNFDITAKENSKNKTGTYTPSGKEKEFTFNYWVKTDDDNDFEYGSNNITISVIGSSGKSAIRTVNFILDDRGPDISFNTTGGEKITMTGDQVSSISGINVSAAGWNSYRDSLYETRIKDRSASAKISGRFTDEYNAISDGNGKYRFWYKIDGPGNLNNGTIKYQDVTTTNVKSKSVPWEIQIPEQMADGIYRLTIGVSDVIGNGYDGSKIPAAVNGVTYGYETNMAFMVDRTAPTLDMGKIVGAVFDGNTNINFTGSVNGTYKVENLSMIINSGTDKEETIKLNFSENGAKTFTITPQIINTAKLNHGRQNIVISVTGSSDQTRNETVSFIVDKEGPDVTISGKSKIYEDAIGNAGTLTASLNSGSINPRSWNNDVNLSKIYNERLKDNSAKLELVIYDEFSPPLPATTFSYSINGGTPEIQSISTPNIPWSAYSTIREGLNTLDITVTDNLNNVTKEQKIVFMVDRKVPTLEVSGIKSNDVFSGKTNVPISGVVKNVYDVTRLSLIFNGEELSVQGTEVAQYLNYNTGKGGFPFDFTIPSSKFTGKHGAFTVLVSAVGSSGQSKMENYSIIIDQKGPSIDVNIPSGGQIYPQDGNIPGVNLLLANSVKETPARLSGSFNDEYSPVYSSTTNDGYWYKISGDGGNVPWTKVTEKTITDSKSAAWQVPVPDTFPDGVYLLSLRVKDSLGNGFDTGSSPSDNSGEGYINNLVFLLDRSAPVLTFEPINMTLNGTETGFSVKGTVKNTYSVNNFNVRIGDTAKGDILYSGSDRSFTFDSWVQTQNDPKLVYGPNIVTISVTGSSGQSAVATQSFILDNIGPEISFNTTGGEKVYMDASLASTIGGKDISDSAWDSYRASLYETRIKDRSVTAKLIGRFSDEYTAITAADGKYTFRYKIDGPGNVTNDTWESITTTAAANSKSVTWEIPIPTDKKDGIYRLSVAVRDRLNNGYYENSGIISPSSGNYGYEANMAFMIDRSAPTLNITKITAGDVFGKNTDVKFEGTVSGTYDVQNLSMSINGGEPENLTVYVSSSGAKTFTINTNTLNTKDLTDDGKQNVVFTATGSSDQTDSKTISFIFDKIGPEVEISGKTKIIESVLGVNTTAFINAGLGNGSQNPRDWTNNVYLKSIYSDRLKDDSAKLTLNIKDTYSYLKTLEYKINDDTETWKTLTISTTSKDASVDIPWSELGSGIIKDGLNKLDIRVSDILSNETNDIGVVFMVDRKIPILRVEGIGDNQAYSGSNNLKLTGAVSNVYDVTRLSLLFNKIELKAQTQGTEEGPGKYLNYENGEFPFEFTIPISEELYGPQSVLITAVGSSGKSTPSDYNIIIDTKGPNVSVSVPSGKIYMTDTDKNSLNTALNSGSLTGDQQTTYNSLKNMLITDTSTKLSGTFNDEYSAVTNDTNKTFWWQIDGGAWTTGNLPVSDNKSVGWEVPIDNLGDGVHLLNIRAKDKWGNGYAGGSTPVGDGGYGYENNVAFMIDRSSPEITNLKVPEAALKTQFSVSGKIENTYGIKRLSIKLGNDEIAVIDENGNKTYPAAVNGKIYGSDINVTRSAGKTFDFTAEIDPSLGGLQDGPISLTFTAIGSSGQVAIGVGNFILDTTGPAIAIGAPISESVFVGNTEYTNLENAVNSGNFTGISTDPNSTYDKIFKSRVKDSSASFTVTFTDDKSPVFSAGNKTYWYSFDGQPFETKEVESTDFGKKSVSVKLPLPKWENPNGMHTLSIRVMDSLGNGFNSGPTISAPGSKEGYINNLIFMIDSGTPKLSFSINSPVIINDQGSLILSGDITDTFEVQELSVKIGSTVVAGKTGENITLINVNETNNKKKFNFTNVNIDNSAISAATEGVEGSYTISVTVKGSSDQSEMKVDTFILDTQGPKISINSPIKEKIYLDYDKITKINAAISSNDIDSLASSNLKTVYYNLLKYNVKDASAGLTGSFADTYSDIGDHFWYSFNGGDWKEETPIQNGSNKKSMDWLIPLSELNDGLNQLSIRVMDALDNGFSGGTNPAGESGNGYETNITFILDTGVPTLTSGDFVDNTVNGPAPDHFTVSGQIIGTFMVKRLSVSLKPPLATIIEIPIDGGKPNIIPNDGYIQNINITPAAGKGKIFNYSFDVYFYRNQSGGKIPLEYGPHSVTVNAIGSSDQSDIKILPFIYDNRGPAITVNTPITQKVYLNDSDWAKIKSGSIDGDLLTKYNKLIEMGIKDASAGLNGYFNDEYSEIGNTFWYKFLDDPNPKWESLDITTKEKSVAWTIPLTDPNNSEKFRDDGIYRVSLRVKDELGNGYDDTDNTITGTDWGHETELAFIIDMGIPKFTKFKLERNGVESDTNIFYNGNFKIIGTIENTVSIKNLSAKISGNEIAVGSGIGESPDGVIIKPVEGAEKKFTFEIPVDPKALNLVEKAHSISVTVTGSSGQSSIETSNFTYDITPPSANFNSPVAGTKHESGKFVNTSGEYSIWWSGSWETGEIKIGGVADDKYGVDKIYYRIGKMKDNNFADGDTHAEREALYMNDDLWTPTYLDEDSPAAKWSGGLYYWNYQDNLNPYQFAPSLIEKNVDTVSTTQHTPNMFYLPFYVKVVDRAGNINVVQYKVYVDPDKDIPSTRIVSPSNNVRVGGEIRITGTASDNNWVHSVDIRIIDATKNKGDEGYYYISPGDEWFDEKEGWIKAKIAGNTDTTVSWFYSINADGALNPATGEQDRHVQVQVRAWDTKDTVYHEIPDVVSNASLPFNYTFDSGVPTISIPKISKTGIETRDYTDGIRVSGTFKVSADVQDDGGISSIRARLTGDTAFTEIVKNGVVVTSALKNGWKVNAPQSVSQNSWMKGYRYYITNPGNISNWSAIDLDYVPGKSYGEGTTIKYKGSDYGANISGSGAAMQAVGTKVNITGNDENDKKSASWNTQFFKYTVEFEIVSTSVKNLEYGKTGIFTLELDVYDNNKEPAPYSTRGTFNLGVDNYYPTAEITTQYNATTKKFFVMGTAQDIDNQSGSQQGLARVLVYFSRVIDNVTTYYNPRGIPEGTGDSYYSGGVYNGTNWASNGTGMTSYPNVRDMTKNPVAGDYKPNGDFTNIFPLLKEITRVKTDSSITTTQKIWESPHAMIIDSQEVGEDSDTDGDGTFAELWQGVGKVEWQAMLDTTKFQDGPITVHYIIMDLAGNATHYSDDIYIGNKKPLIRSINLGTDINADESVAIWNNNASPGEYLTTPFTIGETEGGNAEITTGFRVRNSRFGIRLDALFGNGTKHYKISYVTRNETEVQSTAMNRGTVYTIKTAGNTEWTKYGALNNKVGTTFVATGKARPKNDKGDVTTGAVYEYTYGGTTTVKSGNFGADNYTDDGKQVDYVNGIIFDDFTSMPDTIPGKTYDANGNMNLLHDKRFIVKVYDTTVPGKGEDQQLAHVALLNLDFDNIDEKEPMAVINPFHWTSEDDNSLYGNSKENGHIELGAVPKVSGRISIRGSASDNNIIGSLWANMQGLDLTGGTPENTYFRIANFTPAGGLVGVGQSDNDANWKNNGWKCTILNAVNDQNGHRVDYRLDIDTGKHSSVAALSQSLKIFARDYSNNAQIVSGTQTTAAAKTSLYTMDIVPYISNIITKLTDAYGPNPPAFSRSAKGWYPVREDEVIAIEGFNLFKSGDPLVDIRQTSNATVRGSALHTNGAGSHNVNKIYARIDNNNNDGNGNDISSGYLVVQVNGIDSINNTNTNTADYNKEGNGLNNNTLTDDRALYVWTTGSMMPTSEAVTSMYSPVMRVTNAGVRVMSYGFYNGQSSGRLKVLRNNSAVEVGVSFSNRMYNTTIGISNGNASWYAAGTDISSAATQNKGFQVGFSTANGTGSTFNRPATAGQNNTDSERNDAATGYQKIIERMGDSVNTRIRYPRIAIQATGSGNRSDGNVDRLFMSYYDDEKKELKVMYGIVGTTNVANINPSSPETVVTNNTAKRGSPYTAAGLMSNGRPVVAWYDAYYRKLYLSWGTGTPSTQTLSGGRTSWVTNNVVTYTTTGAALAANATILVGVGTLPTAAETEVNATEATVTTGGTSFNLSANIGNLNDTVSFVTTSYTPSGTGMTGTGNNARRHFTFPANTFAQNDIVIISYDGVVEGRPRVVRNAGPNYQFTYNGTTNTDTRYQIPEGNDNSDYTKIKVYKVTGNNANVRTATVSSLTNGWQTNAREIDTFKGTHVDMAIDAANNVHLAYYDVSNGGLWYALVKASNGTNTNSVPSGTITKVRVDTYLSAGTKIMLNVRQETRMINNVSTTVYVPYITYAHGSFSETENSVRVAWRTDFTNPDTPPAGSDDNDRLTGAWEVMTVPTNQVPKTDEFICNGVPTSAITGTNGWQEPTGDGHLVKGNQDLAKSILVGYLTENWYEGAILKKNIW
jgi:hypothetical protein